MNTRPLWLRFAIRLSLALTAMVLAMLALFVSFYQYAHIQEAKEYVHTFSQALAKQIQPALLTYNQSELENLVTYLDLQQHILWLTVYNADGEQIIDRSYTPLSDPEREMYLPQQLEEVPQHPSFTQINLMGHYDSTPALHYMMPIRVEGSDAIWGSINLGYTLASNIFTTGHLFQLFGILALFGLVIGVIIVRFFSNWITQPIQNLHKATRSISTGDYTVNLYPTGADEFAELARSFNLMSAEISRTREKLQQQAENLEEMVEARTVELEESKEFNERLIRALPDTIAIHQNGVLKFVNDAGLKLLGYSDPAEVIGRPVLDFVHPRYHDTIRERVRRVNDEGRRVPLTDEVFIRKDRSEIIVEVAAGPIQYKGEPAVVVSLRDITDIRLLQQQAARAERLETVGNIAAQVAHDLNNLLTPIVAYPDMILALLDDNHRAIRFIEDIKRHGERIAEINQQLLTLSRRGHYNLEPLSLNDVLKEVTRLITVPQQVHLKLALSDDLFTISGGESQLSRVFSNLLLNAMDAMDNQGEILVKSYNAYLDKPIIGYERVERGEYAVVSISDNGTGIEKEHLSRIFDPFFTTKTASKVHGSGLGLSVVRNVIRDHQGYIDLETGPTGTTFTLYLPATRSDELNNMDTASDFQGHEHILVVDDDLLQFNVLDELLSSLGYHVSYAGTPEKAISMCQQTPYDILVLDMVLDSDLDGVDVFLQVRRFRPEQKAIIISGFAESHRVKAGLNAGIGSFIRKPLTLDKIAHAIREELDRVDTSGEL
ncbi:MAG: PAS domain S-box protein [Lentisphaeria bacterium]|nr:PAS domain S-box protein [Candidatus Neomarinimicrobiota bacterium]MCF7842342.1 PAS domain S-box protein [Lentisphaeria bacterium]